MQKINPNGHQENIRTRSSEKPEWDKSSKETNMKYHCKGLKSLVLLETSAVSGNHSTTKVKYIQNPGQININCILKP